MKFLLKMVLCFYNFLKNGTNRNIMKFFDIKNNLKDFVVFSPQSISKIDSSFHTQRLSEWQQKKYIKKIRRGYYMFSDVDVNEEVLFLIANTIYSPSYISLEMVFSLYHFIPESVYSITSITTKKSNNFHALNKNFSYKKIKRNLFFGYELRPYMGKYYCIAEKEKALLDYFYLYPHIKNCEDFEGLRFNIFEIKSQLNISLFKKYLQFFESKSLNERVDAFLKYIQ